MGDKNLEEIFNQEVMNAIKTIPALTAAIEKGFDANNEIHEKFDKRIAKLEKSTWVSSGVMGTILVIYEYGKHKFGI